MGEAFDPTLDQMPYWCLARVLPLAKKRSVVRIFAKSAEW